MASDELPVPLHARSIRLKEETVLKDSRLVLAALRIQHNFVKNRLILDDILNF